MQPGTGGCSRLEGKVVLVTGGSHGIGRATAERLAAEGAHVAINYLEGNVAAAAEVAAACGGEAITVAADVTDGSSVRVLAETVERELGPIDVLVNNAGVTSHIAFVDLTEEDWHRVIAVNLTGVFLCCKAVVPSMIERRSGVVVNIASDLGIVGAPKLVHYSASKGGVIALTKALAREAAPHAVRVNAVAPGPIVTEMLTAYPEEFNEGTLAQIPLGRWGRPEDVAGTVAFLASEDASFYAGWVLSPSGGIIM